MRKDETKKIDTIELRPGLAAKACPFCGSLRLDLGEGGHEAESIANVRCQGCGAEGPTVPIKQETNIRPDLPKAGALWDTTIARAEESSVGLWNTRR